MYIYGIYIHIYMYIFMRTEVSIVLRCFMSTHGRRMLQGFLPQLDEFYFTTAEKKILGNCKCIVPNYMND